MIGIAIVTVFSPLLSVLSYRRAGVRWVTAGAYAVLAFVLALGGGFIAFFYWYGATIESGLCGNIPDWAGIAAFAAYAVVASWAAIRPSRVWAWPLAVGAAAATALLVAYCFPGAHAYCET